MAATQDGIKNGARVIIWVYLYRRVPQKSFIVGCGCKEFGEVCILYYKCSRVFNSSEGIGQRSIRKPIECSWNQYRVTHARRDKRRAMLSSRNKLTSSVNIAIIKRTYCIKFCVCLSYQDTLGIFSRPCESRIKKEDLPRYKRVTNSLHNEHFLL